MSEASTDPAGRVNPDSWQREGPRYYYNVCPSLSQAYNAMRIVTTSVLISCPVRVGYGEKRCLDFSLIIKY
jgi:hypothetical protein